MRDFLIICEGVLIEWHDDYSGAVMVEAKVSKDDKLFKNIVGAPNGYVTSLFKANNRDEFTDEVYRILEFHTTLDDRVKREVMRVVCIRIPRRKPSTRWYLPSEIDMYGEGTYRDFEGMYTDEQRDRVVTLVLAWTYGLTNLEERALELLRDMVASGLIEQMSVDEEHELDDPHWDRMTALLVDTLYNVIMCAEWTKSGVNWKQEDEERRNA